VESVKQKIHSIHNLGEPDSQKLIYSGKILQDGQTVGDAGVKEGGFLVLMIKKDKPVKAPVEKKTAPAPAPTPAAAPVAATPAVSAAPAAAAPAASGAAPAPAGGYADVASHLVRVSFLDSS
jgi:UV excision repair protein RAD23